MAHHSLIFTFGIRGNIISILMLLSPMPTFIRVYRKKSTEGFQSIPYVAALLSCTLWIYYAMLKSNDCPLLSINSFGCLVEGIYIAVYIFYAPKKSSNSSGLGTIVQILTLKLVFVMNFGGFLGILAFTRFFSKGLIRLRIVGWFCVAFSAVLFAAPLSIMKLVISAKSVEFMPFNLSIFLSLSAIVWLLYGILLKDLYIALPNVIGLVFGIVQMVFYAIYRDGKKFVDEQKNLPEQIDGIIKLSPLKTFDIHLPISGDNKEVSKEEITEEQRKPNGDSIESLNQVQPMDENSL